MKDTIKTFNVCICDMQKTRGFYVFLRDHYKIAPAELTDLLRSELVNLVSAMDRFIHEFVRIGIINSYTSQLPQTDKCKSIPIKLSTLNKVIECQSRKNPPTCNEETAEYWINNEIKIILRSMSFQKIDKIKDALSYIWNLDHKIPAIMDKMHYPFPEASSNANQKFLEKKIDLIVTRRNQIVHEADYDISVNSKQTIDVNWLDDTILFVKEFVYSIYENISGDSSYERL
jgi:hypothetical protein